MAITRYCLPSNMYDIGAPVVPAGNSVSHTTAPDALSYARNLRPPAPGARASGMPAGTRDGSAMIESPSPTNNSVLVTSGALRPGLPSGGRLSGLSSGWSRGPSPLGTIHTCSPLLRSMAVMRPYGGFRSGNPSGAGGYARVPRVQARSVTFGSPGTISATNGPVMDSTY